MRPISDFIEAVDHYLKCVFYSNATQQAMRAPNISPDRQGDIHDEHLKAYHAYETALANLDKCGEEVARSHPAVAVGVRATVNRTKGDSGTTADEFKSWWKDAKAELAAAADRTEAAATNVEPPEGKRKRKAKAVNISSSDAIRNALMVHHSFTPGENSVNQSEALKLEDLPSLVPNYTCHRNTWEPFFKKRLDGGIKAYQNACTDQSRLIAVLEKLCSDSPPADRAIDRSPKKGSKPPRDRDDGTGKFHEITKVDEALDGDRMDYYSYGRDDD